MTNVIDALGHTWVHESGLIL